MPAHTAVVFAFAILVAGATTKDTKPTKRQLQFYYGPGEAGQDPRQLDPRTVQDPRQLDPRAAQDPRQLDPRIAQDPRQLDPRIAQDPRQLDPRGIALVSGPRGLVDPRTGRLVQVDPRQGLDPSQLDPAQLQAFQLGFDPRQPQQGLSAEYNQLLRLIEGNQEAVQGPPQQFVQPNLSSRRPQQFSGQPTPAPVRLTQEQIEQNQLQEGIASKGIREQEARDAQRLQQLELQQYLQQQGISPEYLRQLQVQPQLIQRGQLGGDPRGAAEAQQRQAQAEAQAEAQQRQAQAEAQAEAQARAQAEAQQRAQAEEQARDHAEAQARAQAEAKARAQAEAQARAQARAQAEAQARSQARAQAEAHQARAQAEAQKRAQADEEERAREEQSRAFAATLAARAQLQQSPKATAQQRQPQYVLQPQYESEPIPDGPERVSYSTVQFGSTKLPGPPRIFSSHSPRQQIYLASHPNAPQPSPQPEYVEIPQQQSGYKQKIQYSPEQLQAYGEQPVNPGIPEVIVKDRQTPNQYLIETTNYEANPRPINVQPAFRPQPSALRESQETIAQRVAEQRERAIYTHQALEAATPDAPSRSSIFVTTSRTPALRPKPQEPEVHQEGGRPLTQGELKALLNGFKFRPHPQQPASEEPGVTYYQRGARLRKRQDKPVPKPVPLTEDERQSLAREGIRGVYRIEPAGDEEGEHVKYVLALAKPIPGH